MSPQGWEGVTRARAEIDRKMASGGPRFYYFKLPDDGDQAIVRFLEDGETLSWAYVHEFPPPPGKEFPTQVVCCDTEDEGTPCPMCERGMKRSFKGWINVIWRDAPVYKRDEDNKLVRDRKNNLIVVGTADQVAVWTSGINLFEELKGKDATYKGLKTRDFQITRHGQKLKTKYSVDPAVDPATGDPVRTPMSEADKKLAEDKYDFAKVTEPPSYNDAMKLVQSGGQRDTREDDDDEDEPAQASGNVFINRARQRQQAG